MGETRHDRGTPRVEGPLFGRGYHRTRRLETTLES